MATQTISDLDQIYTFRNQPEVLGFIRDNSFLTPLLFEAWNVIRKYFPSDLLFLEVYQDLESPNSSQLIIFIATSLKAQAAGQALDKIDQEWWLNNFERARGKLAINLEFQ
jgi:hypothetical protein